MFCCPSRRSTAAQPTATAAGGCGCGGHNNTKSVVGGSHFSTTAPIRRLFVRQGCPYCRKVLDFLDTHGLKDKVVVEFDTPENRLFIQNNVGRCTFPALEVVPGKVMLESGDIIKLFAKENGVGAN